MTVLERFLNYVVVETTSDPYAESFPSTKSQLDFGHTLMEEDVYKRQYNTLLFCHF